MLAVEDFSLHSERKQRPISHKHLVMLTEPFLIVSPVITDQLIPVYVLSFR